MYQIILFCYNLSIQSQSDLNNRCVMKCCHHKWKIKSVIFTELNNHDHAQHSSKLFNCGKFSIALGGVNLSPGLEYQQMF